MINEKRFTPAFGVIAASAVTAAFLLTEFILVRTGVMGTGARMYMVDGICRLFFGTVSMVLLHKRYGKRLEEKMKIRFSGPVALMMIPLALYLGVHLCYCFVSTSYTLKMLTIFLINCVQQLLTGYFEEATSRGLMLSGMMPKYKLSYQGRLKMVLTSGLVFGVFHILNVIFTGDILGSVWQGFCTAMWGMFIAAVYMCSNSLLLVMVIHAVWDIAVRVPNAFMMVPETGLAPEVIETVKDVIEFGIMPVAAILICIFYDKIYMKKAPVRIKESEAQEQ
ncbi:MAG: CPBP family intramembrane metalloprotease [Ruminococcus sp.]|nr:CPBP family intramembrane metalloprotease [Ruminococcus sp.]